MTDRGAAQRRRERRLRSWLKHERLTVAMELAAALHHSRDGGPGSHNALRGQKAASSGREGEVREPYDALRGQKRPPPGTRPAPLAEVAQPQWGAVTVGYVAATVTSSRTAGPGAVVTPSYASTLAFLVGRAMEDARKAEEAKAKEKEKAEEEVKRQEVQEVARLTKLQAEWDALIVFGLETLSPHQKKRLNAILQEREAIWDRRERRREAAASSSHPGTGTRRKRKKRRKRRTRRTRMRW